VLTSPLGRAAETGRIIAGALGLPLLGDLPGVVERHYGMAEGLPVDDAFRRYPDGDFPGSETEQAVTERGLASLARLHTEFAGRHVLVVAHGGLIHNVLSALHHEAVPTIINSAVSVVAFEPDREWVVRAINNEHLDTRVMEQR
jgi:probable phosphoglycerate mutase